MMQSWIQFGLGLSLIVVAFESIMISLLYHYRIHLQRRPISPSKKNFFKFLICSALSIKLIYYLYFAPRGFYLFNCLPDENTFEDDEIRLRIYRQTVVVMYYVHIVDYARIGMLVVQWVAVHVYYTRKARRERVRIES
jgi:hypothetical protein